MSDPYEGMGGSYVIDKSGERKLVHRTRNPGDSPPELAGSDEQEAKDQPAEAGFFTPVAPAEQSTTTE